MGWSGISLPTQLLLFSVAAAVAILTVPLHITGAENLYNIVYKGCSRGGAASPPAVAAVSTALLAQASSSKFYKTTSSTNTGQAIFGLFQCRGDLSNADCTACVSRALPMWAAQCGATAAAARVQLTGCYAFYQVAGFPQVGSTQMLYKTCSTTGGGSVDFEEKRDAALSTLENGVNGGGGFYTTSYGSVYTMAQCEGDLSTGDCAVCVTQAVQRTQVECGGAAAGQVYLDKCYVSYSYYANGVPKFSPGGGGGGGGGGQNTAKTVAIVVGGAAGVGFLVICLLFANSLRKKKDDY